MGICTIGTCSTWTNHGFRFHVPDNRICSCNPRRPPPSRNACAFWKLSWSGDRRARRFRPLDRPPVQRGHDADLVRLDPVQVQLLRRHAVLCASADVMTVNSAVLMR